MTPGGSRAARLSRPVLILGAVILALYWAPRLPQKQDLVFRFGSYRERVTGLEASWERRGEGEPAGGVTLRFASPPPREVHHRVSLANGKYIIGAVVTMKSNSGNPTQTNWVRSVTLDGHETTLLLYDEP